MQMIKIVLKLTCLKIHAYSCYMLLFRFEQVHLVKNCNANIKFTELFYFSKSELQLYIIVLLRITKIT
jgi:hypothetical protein